MHDVGLALEIILDDPHPALWNPHMSRETLRFLRKRGHDIPKNDLSRLIEAILKGPPRELYRSDLSNEEWTERRDHQIRLRLYKLIESGTSLPKSAHEVFDRIQNTIPWKPRGDMSEEFPYFLSSGWGSDDQSGAMEDFGSMSVEDFIGWSATQKGNPWNCGGGWHIFSKSDPKTALRLLKGASEHNAWPVPPWYTALSISEATDNLPKELEQETAKSLAGMPLDVLVKLDLQAARWLETVRPKLGKTLRQKVWYRVWDAAHLDSEPEGDLDFDMTLNHAGGILGQVIYDELAEYIPHISAGEKPGFPRQLRRAFCDIAKDESAPGRLARVRIVPMLYILYRIDPEWTKLALLRRMDIENELLFDRYLWEGYLWSPRFTDDLFGDFKTLFFNILSNLDQIPATIRPHGPQLFIHMAIPPDRFITTDEAKGVLYNLKPDQLADAASALKDLLSGASAKAPELWRDSIGPWFDKAWPKRPQDKSDTLSENLAWMATDSGDAFPDVVPAIVNLLMPEEWDRTIFHLMESEEKTGLVRRFPNAALKLVDKIVDDSSRIMTDTLKRFLDTIAAADPDLAKHAAFERLALKAE